MSQRHRVRIEQPSGESWALLDVLPADIVTDDAGTRVCVRYRAGVTDRMRLVMGQQTLRIVSVENVGGRNRELVIRVAA